MPTTRARARASAPCRLLELPDELLLSIGEHTYSQQLPTALRLLQTCKRWRAILAPVQQKAAVRRLRWRVYPDANLRWRMGESLLPQTGRSKFCIRITGADEGVGYHRIGVCDAHGRCGWGFNPCSGKLLRVLQDEGFDSTSGAPPLHTASYPGHDQTHLWYDADGEQLMSTLRGTAPDDDDRDDPSGLAIRIEYRPEAGLVIFCVGDGLPVTLSGFGAPLRLRPWAYTMYEEDRLAFERRFIEYDAEFKNIVAC